MLIDRILQLEATVARQPSSHSQTPSAFPRALQSTHAQTAFQANLHEALHEVRSEDPSVDPLYTFRHIGPQTRKRKLEEIKERGEEEARDARKAQRRGKAPNPAKAKDTGAAPPFPPPPNPAGSPATAPSSSRSLLAPSGRKRIKIPAVAPREPAPTVPRDKNGKPILPLNVGIMTVNCLGEVCMREYFHTERYIYPVGYSVNRYGP